MLQLGSEEPFRLPWVLRPLGYWKIQSFLTQLGHNTVFYLVLPAVNKFLGDVSWGKRERDYDGFEIRSADEVG